jgi:bacterioferritin-associated ferredoxin
MVFIAITTAVACKTNCGHCQNKAAKADLRQVLVFMARRQVQSVEFNHLFDLTG